MKTDERGQSSVDDLAQGFADNLDRLVTGCLPDAPPVQLVVVGSQLRIHPVGQDEKSGGIPLRVSVGEIPAWLRLYYQCTTDSYGSHLTVANSKIWIVATDDPIPIFRFEYHRDSRRSPHSHIHVHAERETLAELLTTTGHHHLRMSDLHLPTGGARFRPELEDVIQFLLVDCGFEGQVHWRDALGESRARWREIQTRAVTRALPQTAAEQLASMGYTVEPPVGGHPAPATKATEAW